MRKLPKVQRYIYRRLKVVNLLAAVLCIAQFMLSACAVPPPGNAKHDGAGSSASSFSSLLEQYGKLTDSQRIDTLEEIQNAGSTSPADHQQACYMLARLLQKSGDVKGAQRAIQLYQTANDQSALWQRCQLHIAECAAITGQEKIARSALNALMGSADASRDEKAQAQYSLAQSFLRANEKNDALKAFEIVRTHYLKTEYATGTLYYLGTINLGSNTLQGRNTGLNCFRKYLVLSPDGHFAADIVQQMQSLQGFTPIPQDRALFAHVLYLQGKYKDALADWMQSHSDAHFVEQAKCRVQLSDITGARKQLQAGIFGHPNSPDVVPAAQLYSRLSSKSDALKIWQTVLKASPRNADVALWNIASRQDTPQALATYKMLVQKYPNSNFAPDSTWWLIWWHATSGADKKPSTIAQLRAALKRYEKAKAGPRFAFWIGKFEEAAGQPSQARSSYMWTLKQFPSSYYGFRAQSRLSKLNGGSDPGWVTGIGGCLANTKWDWPNEPAQIKFEDVSAASGYSVAVLSMLKQWDEALQLMPKSEDPVVMAWCLANQNQPLEAINAAVAGIKGSPRLDARWQFAYPLLYGDLISPAAHNKQVDPCLIHALIREESRYFSHAVSKSNALGLMQLLPTTASATATSCGINLKNMQDCFVPDINIRLGTTYFGSLHQRFDGNDLLAVAAYNGGPNAVRSWKGGISDPDVFVENIPIDETRDYVRKVFGSYWCYRKIYGNNF